MSTPGPETEFGCIIVGSGHAGSCAAIASVEAGCNKVLIVDKCPVEWRGGNGYFTAGAHRTVHGGLHDLLPLVRNVSAEDANRIEMDAYTRSEFVEDIMRLGDGRSDAAMVDAVVDGSRETIGWLADAVGVPFIFSFNRQAYEVDGKQKFWGGMVLSVEEGGKGLIKAHQIALEKMGVDVWFETRAVKLLVDENGICGLVVEKGNQELVLRTRAVVLAAGGFEANPQLRAKHLGAGWEKARIRGTPYNTGDGFALAEFIGAKFTGDWGGCHSTAWDANAPADAGERERTNQFTKSGYPLGIMVNSKGDRFVDEGEDFRNYTYAKFGRAILAQAGGFAFQIWDSKVIGHLRKEEYGDGIVEKMLADNIEELATKLGAKGLKDQRKFLSTIRVFNEAILLHRNEHPKVRWDPSVKDRLSTQSEMMQLELPKSNWALPIDEAPFMAVKVACGITFTFGGLAIDPSTSGVLSGATGQPISGLFCAGEMVGGLFYGNYPGGSGLTAGAVFGRKAGQAAASRTRK
ncbi:FAD binding domain-containing protein [Infundibulicybe gibba]|nr:FAD binding domain-containing protein [Infundibulicybe gibba]